MNRLLLVLLICSLFVCNGCVVGIGLLARRMVVKDDVVLVKDENVLYKRYIYDGTFLRGNKKLLEKVGDINANNDKVIVFKNYQAAIDSGMEFTVDEESKKALEPEEAREVSDNE